MCLNPKWIYKKGNYKETNYRGVEGELYEIGTFSKCGVCEQCINSKCNDWVVRNWYEQRAHKKKSFITLTYRDNPFFLVRKDGQDFMKRFRIHLDRTTGEKVRIFQAGEYGTLNGRSHFHYIVYGWEDQNAKYLDINKKGNLIYKSKTIEDIWGLGRTTYQSFGDHEIPYLTLYETPQDTFKKAYKLNFEKAKKIEELARRNIRDKGQKENLIKELEEHRRELERSKKEYLAIKEFNAWSMSLGWEEFYKEYTSTRGKYVFTCYIENKEYPIPSSWVKKLANMGHTDAAEEMFKREEMQERETNELREKAKNRDKIQARRKRDLEKWIDKRRGLEDF